MNKSANEKAWRALLRDLRGWETFYFNNQSPFQLQAMRNAINLVEGHMPKSATRRNK